jgi:hypothetical protein
VRGVARLAGVLAAGAALGAAAAPAGPPGIGRYAVQLCVATASARPSCGPAQADMNADGLLRVRVDDVVYNMQLRPRQVEIVVMHNVVEIDELITPYRWVGRTLTFNDDDRHSRYEVRFPAAH